MHTVMDEWGRGGSVDFDAMRRRRRAAALVAILEQGPLRPHDQRGFKLLSSD